MKFTADEIEEAVDLMNAGHKSPTPVGMLREYAALCRLIEKASEAIDAIEIEHGTVFLSGTSYVVSLEYARRQGKVSRALAAALELEHARSAKLKDDYDGMLECAKAHDAARTKYLLENVKLRAVFECARSVLRNNVGGSKEHAILLSKALDELDTACEAVKLRDSGLADEWIDKNVSGNPTLVQAMKNIAKDETINAAAAGARGPYSGQDGATNPIEHPGVAAPDQEGLAEALFKCIPSVFTDSMSCSVPAKLICQVTYALRNSAKPAAEIHEGWQLVPKQPTKEMLDAIPWPTNVTPRLGIDCYTAMLAAAPSPPSNNRSET